MNNCVVIFLYYFINIIHKSKYIFCIWRNLIHFSAHSRYLFSDIHRTIIVNDKIKLYLTSINMFIVVHNDSFYTATSYDS